MKKIRCWVCKKIVTSENYDHKAGQCKECEARNSMPICMRPGFRWPIW